MTTNSATTENANADIRIGSDMAVNDGTFEEKMYDSEEEAAKLRQEKEDKIAEEQSKLSKKELRKQKKQDKLRSQYDAIINHGDGDQFTLAQQDDTYKGK